MKNCLERKKLYNKGFTLLELVIVMAIIVLLSASIVVLFNPGEKQKEQRDALRVSSLSQIASAMELYYAQFKKYPAQLSDLGSINFKVSLSDPSSTSTDFGCDYKYFVNTTYSYYEIYSVKESKNFTVPKGQDFVVEDNLANMNPNLIFNDCSVVLNDESSGEDMKVFKIVGGVQAP